MKIIICGDLSVTNNTRPVFEAQDKDAAFADVQGLFATADRVMVNLECALTDSEHRIKKCGPNLKGPKATADTLKAVGVTECLLSNNHIFDFGVEGALDTLKALDESGLEYTGFGKDYEDSRRDLIIEKNGEKTDRIYKKPRYFSTSRTTWTMRSSASCTAPFMAFSPIRWSVAASEVTRLTASHKAAAVRSFSSIQIAASRRTSTCALWNW